MDLTICPDSIPTFLNAFDLSIAPPLLFYSYIPAIAIALAIGTFVLIKDKYSLQSRLLFGICISLAIWVFNLIFQWTIAYVRIDMFSWQIIPYFEVLILILTIYFAYVFLNKKDLPLYAKVALASVIVFLTLLLPTKLNVSGFDFYYCEAIYNSLYNYFIYPFEFLTIFIVGGICLRKFLTTDAKEDRERKKALILGVSSVLFLTIFFLSNLFGEITGVYEFNLWGPVGIIIFLGFLSYMTVQYKLFNVQLAAPIALVISLWALVFSLIFIQTPGTIRIIVSVTLVLLIGFSAALIGSIKRELKQKEEIEKLAEQLKVANKRLKKLDQMKSEFVSIASHQLRSPLTSIRGYASMLIEGSYGKFPAKAREVLENIADSSRYMALSVEDYLNVSRIESGNMKYENSDFNFKELAETVADEMRPEAIRRGLLITFKSNVDSKGIINADVGKTKQIVQNLVDNAMKYTPKGQIKVLVHDDVKSKEIFVDVIDNGIGMSPETLAAVFDKFERAQNANQVNVTGTGLGLYIARTMARAMGGDVYATSEGENNGSVFTIKMPLAL